MVTRNGTRLMAAALVSVTWVFVGSILIAPSTGVAQLIPSKKARAGRFPPATAEQTNGQYSVFEQWVEHPQRIGSGRRCHRFSSMLS